MKTHFITTLLLAPLAAMHAAEAVKLSPEHLAAVRHPIPLLTALLHTSEFPFNH